MTNWLERLKELDAEATPGLFKVIEDSTGRIDIKGSGYSLFSEGYNPQAGDWTTSNLTKETWYLLCHLKNKSKEIAELVYQAQIVSEFFEGRWCEDHAYRERFLKPLRYALNDLLREEM